MKPVVDGLEKEMAGKLVVLRVDIHTKDGRVLAKELDFQYTPTFILFNANGAEVWRDVGSLNVDRVRQSLGQ